jgi:hypothetical protein
MSEQSQWVSNPQGEIDDLLSHESATKITVSIRSHPTRASKFCGLALIITSHPFYIESLESVIPKLFESQHTEPKSL